MLKQLINKLLGGFTERYEWLDEQDVEKAIDIILEETDPRLRMVGGYRRKLRKPVIRSLVYVNKLVTRIPGAFEVNRKSFGASPQVNALFGSVDDIDELIIRSRVLKQYFDEYPDRDAAYATLVMHRVDKNVLGMELGGDIVKRDVAQVAVNFSGHRLGICASSESELRDMLIWRGIHNLAITALDNITHLKMKTTELQKQSVLLKIKLRDLQAQHRGLDALTAADTDEAQDTQSLARELEETERQLSEAQPRLGTLDDYLTQVRRVFNHPSRYLRVKPDAVRVDRMGIKVENEKSGRGAEVVSANITIGRNPPVAGLLVVFNREDMRSINIKPLSFT